MQIVIITLFPLPLVSSSAVDCGQNRAREMKLNMKADRHEAATFDPELQTFIIVKLHCELPFWLIALRRIRSFSYRYRYVYEPCLCRIRIFGKHIKRATCCRIVWSTLMCCDNNTTSCFMAACEGVALSVCVCVLFWEIMNTALRINYSNNSQASTTTGLSVRVEVWVCSCVCGGL